MVGLNKSQAVCRCQWAAILLSILWGNGGWVWQIHLWVLLRLFKLHHHDEAQKNNLLHLGGHLVQVIFVNISVVCKKLSLNQLPKLETRRLLHKWLPWHDWTPWIHSGLILTFAGNQKLEKIVVSPLLLIPSSLFTRDSAVRQPSFFLECSSF